MICCKFLEFAMVLAKFLCQPMACNFVILEKKIHKEKKMLMTELLQNPMILEDKFITN